MKNIFIIFYFLIGLTACVSEKPPETETLYDLKSQINSELKVELKWNSIKTDPAVNTYEIYKSVSSEANFAKIATIEAKSENIFIDDFVIDGSKIYFYKVRGINALTAQPFSNVTKYKTTTDIDEDGFIEDDCAANIKSINPTAEEICDNTDNNCNDGIDENTDKDCSNSCGEGIEKCQNGIYLQCSAPKIKPEECDGEDNDCNGKKDDNLTIDCSNSCGFGEIRCIEGVYTECSAPKSEEEKCDNIDNDCDTFIDEDLNIECSTECGTGFQYCIEGEYTECDAIKPENEICDNYDNNCDGNIDENLYTDCDNGCGQGRSVCVEGHWLGCDAPLLSGNMLTRNFPSLRTNFASTNRYNNNDFFIFGGNENSLIYLNDLWKFDSNIKEWVYINIVGNKPKERINSSIAYDFVANKVYLYGGMDFEGNILNDFWVADLTINQWIPVFATGEMPTEMFGHKIIFDGYSQLILIGGKNNSGFVENIYRYSIWENVWSTINSSEKISPRYLHSAVLHRGRGEIIVFGGKNNSEHFNDVWSFNLSNYNWTQYQINTSIQARINASLFIDNDNLYLSGGRNNNTLLNDLHIYNFPSQTWRIPSISLENLPQERENFIMYKSKDGYFTIFGGNNSDNSLMTEIYYNINEEKYENPDFNLKLTNSVIEFVPFENAIYLFGGYNGRNYINDFWKYDLSLKIWTKIETETTPQPRASHSLTYNPEDNSLYLFGGRNSIQQFKTLWKFNLATQNWEQITTVGGPNSRFGHYAFIREGYLYVFGGYEDGIKMDLIKFNFSTLSWENVDYIGEVPQTRLNYSVVYSESYRYLILFGGYAGTYLNDLWLFDFYTQKWTSYFIGIVKPLERSESKFVYDQETNNIFLIGGISTNDLILNDIWSLQLGTTNWKELSANSIGKYYLNRLNFNAFSNINFEKEIIIFGGNNNENYYYDLIKLKLLCTE